MPLPRLLATGEGPPLLLLHAFPQDASMWDQQVAALSDAHRCLRVDAYGCGGSPPPPAEPRTIDEWADDVLLAVDAVDGGPLAVAGSSMGGHLAFALLRRARHRVAGLALLGTRGAADTEPARADRLRMAARARAGEDVVGELVASMPARLLSEAALGSFHVSDPVRGRIRRCTPEGIAFCQAAMAGRPDSGGLLSGVRVPTLVVAGAADAIVPVDEARQMAAAVAGARLAVLEGAGHLVGVERHAETTQLMREWLDRVDWQPAS